VDPAANGSVAPVGDLDPNGRMAWSWDVGYKFVLFEGGLVLADTQYPLVYHVGFNENYTPLSFGLDRLRSSGTRERRRRVPGTLRRPGSTWRESSRSPRP